jgi:hypothetical protein
VQSLKITFGLRFSDKDSVKIRCNRNIPVKGRAQRSRKPCCHGGLSGDGALPSDPEETKREPEDWLGYKKL